MVCLKLIFILIAIKSASLKKASFKVVLERGLVKYKDSVYIGPSDTNVVKANRTSPYVLNLNFDIIKPWDYNVSLELKTFEMRNNQYRESIIRAELDMCFAVANDQWLAPVFRKYSNLPKKCPIKAGKFSIKDFILPVELVPDNFPPGRWRFDFKFFVTSIRKYIFKFNLFFKIETTIARKTTQKKKS